MTWLLVGRSFSPERQHESIRFNFAMLTRMDSFPCFYRWSAIDIFAQSCRVALWKVSLDSYRYRPHIKKHYANGFKFNNVPPEWLLGMTLGLARYVVGVKCVQRVY